jgi:hypothetical protein
MLGFFGFSISILGTIFIVVQQVSNGTMLFLGNEWLSSVGESYSGQKVSAQISYTPISILLQTINRVIMHSTSLSLRDSMSKVKILFSCLSLLKSRRLKSHQRKKVLPNIWQKISKE